MKLVLKARRFAVILILISVCRMRVSGGLLLHEGNFLDAGTPAAGEYDLRFTLYDAATGGTAVTNLVLTSYPVTNGYFKVLLDFGSEPAAGAERWLATE